MTGAPDACSRLIASSRVARLADHAASLERARRLGGLEPKPAARRDRPRRDTTGRVVARAVDASSRDIAARQAVRSKPRMVASLVAICWPMT
jgi:hypothetical protein